MASTGHGSLPRRLAHALRHLIDAGVLPGGWRVPPERALANQLAVSRNSFTQALDELRAEGRLRLRGAIDAALDQLAETIPDAEITRPDGG